MRREGARPGWVALTCAAGLLGVLFWLHPPSSVEVDAQGIASPQSKAPPAPVTASRPVGVPPPNSLPDSTPSALVTPVPAWMRGGPAQDVSRPPPATTVSASHAPSAFTQERAPDGLPLTAMRCRITEGGLDCGACRIDGDCPAGQGCVANRQTRRFECMASECSDDAHCQTGSLCRAVTTGATGSIIRRCMPEGTQGEGRTCDSLPASSAYACHEGLRCVAQVCTLPCSLDGRESCAPGFVCTEGLDGPGCVADCRQLGCPEAQSCARVRETDYRCVAEVQGNCLETPCPDGERCNMRMSREKKAVFWCARICNPLLADACAAGEVCGVGSPTVSTCFRQCDPRQNDVCGPGWTCGTVTEDMSVFGCGPDL